MKVLYTSLPYQVLSELEHHKEAEQAEPRHEAHHGERAHIGRVADVKVLSSQEQRPTNDGLRINKKVIHVFFPSSFCQS